MREIDDCAPRANIGKQFKSSFISSSNCEKISLFSKTFCVEEKYVVSYVTHLEKLAATEKIRERKTKLKVTIEETKIYDDYNWFDLIDSIRKNETNLKSKNLTNSF